MGRAIDKRAATLTERDFQRRLVELGLIKEIKSPVSAERAPQDREPIAIEGRPVSELIIEERR